MGHLVDLDYSCDIDADLDKYRAMVLSDVSNVNLIEVFRVNHKKFEEIIAFWMLHKSLGKKLGTNGTKEIKKHLLAKGHIKSMDDVSDTHVRKYMSDIREELNVQLKIKRAANLPNGKNKGGLGVTPTGGENSNCHSVEVAQSIEIKGGSSSQDKWLSKDWIGEEPTDWRHYFLKSKETRPGVGEWSDEFENVWRWIHKLAVEEYKLNPNRLDMISTFEPMGENMKDLWFDLWTHRKTIANKYGFNPSGVGVKN